MKNSFPTIIEKSTKLSSSTNGVFNPDNLPSKDIANLAKYFNLGYKECGTLWDKSDKLDPQSILTTISFDSCKHLLGEDDTPENWSAFKTGAIAQLENIGNNQNEFDRYYTFIEKHDDHMALIELDRRTFNSFFQKEYPDVLNPILYTTQNFELFLKQICINISISSFIPPKNFNKYCKATLYSLKNTQHIFKFIQIHD